MGLELSFRSVCATIKKHGKNDPKLIEAVDNLLGLALICSPVVIGTAAAAALLPSLRVKNELIKIGKSIFHKLTKKKDEDYLLRHETMRTAYGLIVFTSFFDALDSRLSEPLRKEISLVDTEKAFLAKDATSRADSKKSDTATCDAHDAPVSNHSFPFPHPTETLAEQCRRQAKLWQQMGQGFADFVRKLAFWDAADDQKKSALLSGLKNIEKEAAKRFEAQFFELTRQFEDFAVWANLQAHKGTKALLGELSSFVKHYIKLSTASEESIDVGFTRLRETVLSIPETLRIQQATEIAVSLDKYYQARISETIIEDKDAGDDDKPKLAFPRIRDAFVPQAFRVLRHAGRSLRLEDESTWSELPRRNDLGAFLLSYLSSPYSTETPLLVLGHPGSGKSLLTTILAAQLMSKQFTAIRVPLREVNADADIVTQIEDTIRRITGVSFDSWIKLSALFKNCPPVVILDGYDELLQASGQVFASYIKDAQRLQERETEQGRPLRVIVTSRVTLIDKAAVPAGATIVRLLEFDRHQRERWSGIWNTANASYFQDAGIEKFALPSEGEKGAEKILHLAQQPLLLLMLALYDSQGNQLRDSRGLDRTKLYDSLLRRFVIRERGKERGFDDARPKDREKALSTEMQRLGAAALGMYNRRKVHILSHELDGDLAFFKLEREVAAKPSKALSQADLLLGSFFFVHKSKAQHNSGADDTHEETAAFEFLHNTFGEFLTADFVVRRAVAQVLALRAAEANEALGAIIDKMMGTADGFERDWFASLVYTPLFTRPVIMEMVREWSPHVLREHRLSEEDFVDALEKIVLNQIKRMLSKREMPQIMRKETAQEGYRVPFGDHPLVGHIAIYSINLILLRLTAGKRPFVFDESEVVSHEDGTRPWDRLVHIWRSWFALGNLNELTAVMIAERADSKVTVTARAKFQAKESKSKMQSFYNVALSLGDNAAAGIAGLHVFEPASGSVEELDSLEQRLTSEGFDLGFSIVIARLLTLAEGASKSRDGLADFSRHAKVALLQAAQCGRRDQLEGVHRVVVRTLERASAFTYRGSDRLRIFRELFDPRSVADTASTNPKSVQVVLAFGKQIRDYDWLREFFRQYVELARMPEPEGGVRGWIEWLEFMRDMIASGVFPRHAAGRWTLEVAERMFRPRQLADLGEHAPESALTCLQILHNMNDVAYFGRWVGSGSPAFFEGLFSPRLLWELTELYPEGVLAYLRILQMLGGGRHFERFVRRELRHVFHPIPLMELGTRHPEGALAHLQILRALSGEQDSCDLGSVDLDRVFERQLIALSERNPGAALEYLQTLQELGGGWSFYRFIDRLGPDFFDRMFHPRQLWELSESHPEGALTYLRILQVHGGGRALHRFVEEFLDEVFQPRHLLELGQRRTSPLVFWLAYARSCRSARLNQALARALSEGLPYPFGAKRHLSLLPISSLGDLRWLSGQSENLEFRSLVESELLATLNGTGAPNDG